MTPMDQPFTWGDWYWMEVGAPLVGLLLAALWWGLK